MQWYAIGAVAAVAVASCASPDLPPAGLTSEERAAIADSVERAVRDFGAIQSPALCRDVRPFARYFTYPDGRLIQAGGTSVSAPSQEQHEAQLAGIFCGMQTQEARQDTVIVQVLARDVAIAAWTFDELVTDSAGTTRRIKGSVLQPWLRTADGWKTSGGMDAHVVVPK